MNFSNLDINLLNQLQNFFNEMDRTALAVNIFEICVLAFILYYLFKRFIKRRARI